MFKQTYQRPLLLLLLVSVLALCSGCGIPNLLVYPFAPREAKKDVAKEYDLRAEALLILPYAGSQIELEYPGER